MMTVRTQNAGAAIDEPTIRPDDASTVLEQRRAAVAPLRAELQTIDEQIADLVVARALKSTHDPSRLVALDKRKTELEALIAAEQRVIDALESRSAAIRDDEARTIYEANITRLRALWTQTPALEARYLAAAEELVDAAQAINAIRWEYDRLTVGVGKYLRDHEIGVNPLPDQRQPFMPFQIPESFLRRSDPLGSFAQWLREFRKTHRI
jgi:hypothetical protein